MARLQPSQGRQRPGGCPGAHARAACRTCRRTCAPSPRQATAPRRPCRFVFSQLDPARGSRNRRKRHLDQSGHAPRAKPPTHLLPIAVEEVSARDASRVGGKDARDDAGGLLQGGKCGHTRAQSCRRGVTKQGTQLARWCAHQRGGAARRQRHQPTIARCLLLGACGGARTCCWYSRGAARGEQECFGLYNTHTNRVSLLILHRAPRHAQQGAGDLDPLSVGHDRAV